MPRSKRSFTAIVLVLLAAFGALGWSVLQKPATVPPARATYTAVGHRPDRATASQAPLAAAQPPGRLIIRKIGVDAAVVPVGVDKTNAMDVTKTAYETGWYKFGPAPGDPGDAVIDGHLDWYGTPQAVFFRLKEIQVGDDIEVQGVDGVSRHFRVTRIQTVAYNDTPPDLFTAAGPPRLSLITCGGAWSTKLGQYLQRVVVDSSLVT
jgi:LPXTG-site transpeptidase (sortase) family protein